MSLRHNLIKMLEYSRTHKQFQQYFRVIPALTPELQQEAYRLRYDVYCRELGWEQTNDNEIETDLYDAQSDHCLLQNVKTNEYVGCIRLIRLKPGAPAEPLPFHQACKEILNPGEPCAEQQQRYAFAEVSRLAIHDKYRRRPSDKGRLGNITQADYGSIQQPRFPYIPIGLYMGLLEMARINGIETLYILAKPSLAKHLCKLGGELCPVGTAIEHRGKRIPYKMDVNRVIKQINILLKPLFNVISKEVKQGYIDRDNRLPSDP
ncbi:MAG: N-acyl amino acid synthase of PEP-CTERM/exosortase system [Motiliproteus sp.]|jgi:N-acyl amino acid synthase of PEP-CTERM/exosortase system